MEDIPYLQLPYQSGFTFKPSSTTNPLVGICADFDLISLHLDDIRPACNPPCPLLFPHFWWSWIGLAPGLSFPVFTGACDDFVFLLCGWIGTYVVRGVPGGNSLSLFLPWFLTMKVSSPSNIVLSSCLAFSDTPAGGGSDLIQAWYHVSALHKD